ncbi:hypothetical protein SAMN05421771_4301 [Granulicella pectinivorans]|uniref:Uncharacterized protein n=1 Tax=Granulicella pectinivorans TaxID=474950 RepID=A0A1I6N1A3_9BACT|nr:hypothetical protein [Granulicella pectinivorans]SFS21710.1 hypothetical protein SAMN05421771_4301 [Granulicella pectinivorans]
MVFGWMGRTLLLAGMLVSTGAASAQVNEGCVLDKQTYTCNQAEFTPLWRSAGTVTVEASPRDKMAAAQLREMLVKMGKTVGAAGDLTILVVQRDTSGVEVGPAGIELGSIRVYAPGTDGKRGNLVWAETYTGQPDMSWPAVVHTLVMQFEGKFGKK